MTPEEINEAVARELGWTRCNDEDEGEIRWHSDRPLEPGTLGGTCTSELPDYCRDIKAAWEIVEYGEIGYEVHRYPNSYFTATIRTKGLNIKEKADTAPMAICLAFLKVCGSA